MDNEEYEKYEAQKHREFMKYARKNPAFNEKMAEILTDKNRKIINPKRDKLNFFDENPARNITALLNIYLPKDLNGENLNEEENEEDLIKKVQNTISLAKFEYSMEKAEKIIKEFNIPYYKFSLDEIKSFLTVEEFLRSKVFNNAKLANLLIGDSAELALCKMFYDKNIEFTARSFMIHNSNRKQEVKDITAWSCTNPNEPNKETSIGVRCMNLFDGLCLYPTFRIEQNTNEISDYTVFFNHCGYALYYITCIAEKSFLTDGIYFDKNKTMTSFPIAELLDNEFYFSGCCTEFINNERRNKKPAKSKLTNELIDEFSCAMQEKYSRVLSLDNLVSKLNKKNKVL